MSRISIFNNLLFHTAIAITIQSNPSPAEVQIRVTDRQHKFEPEPLISLTHLTQHKTNTIMSNPGYCGCRTVYPAPRAYPNCTKTPNGHLPCHEYEPPMIEHMPCGRDGIIHVVEPVHPGSSTKRRGNCPNHRSTQYWFVSDGKGGFTGQRSMQTGFNLAAASRAVSAGGQNHGSQGGQNHGSQRGQNHGSQGGQNRGGHGGKKPRTH